MKAPVLVALAAVLALGIGFYAGVKVGATKKLAEPAPETISAGSDRYQHIRKQNLRATDFHKMTSYAGRRQSIR